MEQGKKRAADRPGLGSDNRRREFVRLRAMATGLLVAMAVLFLTAGHFREAFPWLGYVRAFAEAAMVGALADWFAVTALFRHPLGLPIPHTAVIPKNKDRIGESLGKFVEEHFLPPEVVRARLAEVDFGDMAGRWLSDPAHAASLADQITQLLPGLLHSLDDDPVRTFIRDKLKERLDAVELAPLSADILDVLTADNRHQHLLDAALVHINGLVAEKEPYIRQKVRDSTGWLWKKLSVDRKAFDGIMGAVEDLMREVGEDAGHELRQRFDHALREFTGKLRESPEYRARAEAIKREILESPGFQASLEGVWEDLRLRLLADVQAPDSEIRRHIQTGVEKLGAALIADPALRESLNPWLRDTVAGLVESRREEMARLIPDTVRTWDADTMSERLELQVGKDLQFIRINGTLVGGLVGLAIYAVSKWLS
ncbi:MAG TPA: DUF445 domain-containing protein [Rhodocyclaceae bacterium]|nr:DUF445 domain-containing protein [Rhodocyclaceae bacterium]